MQDPVVLRKACDERNELLSRANYTLFAGRMALRAVVFHAGDRQAIRVKPLREGAAMTMDEDTRTYIVLINDEEQYSLWIKGIRIPDGWTAVGVEGTKEECSKHVDKVWVDMRPKSTRRPATSPKPLDS